MKYFTILKNILFVLLLIPSLVYSSGKIKGVVIDTLSNDRLVGANIVIVGTSLGSATDIEGEYSISAIPPGKYIVKCSYIGYRSKQVTVNVVDDRTTELNFTLFYSTIQGEEVVVTGQMQGQVAAINQQLNSNTIVNVISEQKIKELPDANAAEAIGRLPGVSIVRSGGEASKIILRGLGETMTTVTVDGVKLSPTDADSRGIDLSAISQGSLSGIELTKAITSDMDAEAIAGNVNFVTKIAPETREIQIDAYGMYSALDKTSNEYNFLGRFGERFFDDLLGVQVFGNIEKRDRSSEQYNVAYDLNRNTGVVISSGGDLQKKYLINNFNLQYIPEMRERKGGKILLDFKTPDEGTLRLDGEYNRTERRLSTIDRNFPTLGVANSYFYDFRGQDINIDIKNIALQGKNHLFNWDLDWSLSYSESGTETPYDYSMHFTEASSMLNGQVVSGMLPIPESYLTGTSYERIIPYALDNFMATYFDRAEARTTSSLDFDKTAFVDIKKDYNIFDINGEFKFGGKYRSKFHRRNSTLSQAMYYNASGFFDYVKLADGSIVPKDYARYGFPNGKASILMNGGLILLPNFISSATRNIYGKYNLNPIIEPYLARNWYEMNINGYNQMNTLDEYTNDNSGKGSDYSLTENVAAGYVMNTLNFGGFATLILGVRIENDDNDYRAYYAKNEILQSTQFLDTTTSHKESIVLPNFQLILKPTDFMNIRAAAYRGINRPDFNYRLPTYYYGGDNVSFGDNKKVIIAGNTDLKNADAWNYETNMQFYGDKIGLFSISAYYKEIKNLVSTLNYLPVKDRQTLDSLKVPYIPGISFAQLLVFIPYNSQKPTKVWGFEIEHQTNFRYLPGLLSHIVLSYNLSISKTETYTTYQAIVADSVLDPIFGMYIKTTKSIISEKKGPIADAPEVFGNISFGYDISGFSGRISYFYQRQFYTFFSLDNRTNILQKSFDRLDLSLKQEITRFLSVGLNVNNITNSSEGQIQKDDLQGWQGETQSYTFGTSAELWLKVTI
jgi:TonB-dependent receptor